MSVPGAAIVGLRCINALIAALLMDVNEAD